MCCQGAVFGYIEQEANVYWYFVWSSDEMLFSYTKQNKINVEVKIECLSHMLRQNIVKP